MTRKDAVVEAFCHDAQPILGVQFHPERMCLGHARPDTIDGLPLLAHFVSLCRS